MKKPVIWLAALAVALPILVSGAAGRSRIVEGTFVIRCDPSHVAFVDPIVAPGVEPTAHEHQFFGNKTTNKNSTYATMTAAYPSPGSTCKDKKDTAGYWEPTLYRPNGTRVAPLFSFAYYKSQDGPVTPFPADFRMIAGGVGHEQPGEANIEWGCFNTGGDTSTEIPLCTGSGNYLKVNLKFPTCWDGVNTDSADHRSHVHYKVAGSCPASHPVRVPLVNFFIRYPANEGGPGYYLSDGTILPHADFWNTWQQARFEALVADCLNNNPRNCGQVTGT
jgi:uncharacterized protein DUF1996